MESLKKLRERIKSRAEELIRLKKQGARIIGYIPSGYVPEELLWASGAIPVGLIRGGDHEPVLAADAYLWRFIDTFSRAQIGYRVRGEPIYQLPELVVALATDRNIMAAAEMWQHYTGVQVFKYGVPSKKYTPQAFQYYLNGLRMLKQKLEEFTGTEITAERLRDEIELSNRIRGLLEDISHTRKAVYPRISGKDFVMLNHATYYVDRKVLLAGLESVKTGLRKVKVRQPAGPRILLTGSTLAYGDDKVVDLLERNGAAVVIEEFSEGVRHYGQKVKTDGDPMEALTDRYLRQRPAPAFFKECRQEKFDFLFGLMKEFKVDGVVWYTMLYRDGYDRWAVFFAQELEKQGIPFLKLSSGYDPSETDSMRTRVEAFLETVRQRR